LFTPDIIQQVKEEEEEESKREERSKKKRFIIIFDEKNKIKKNFLVIIKLCKFLMRPNFYFLRHRRS
jgi:hypothetical protein